MDLLIDRELRGRSPRARSRRRRRLARRVVGLLSCVALVLALDAFWLEPSRLVLNEATLELPHWPEALAGTRVALVSDLHVGSPYWHLTQLQRLVERTNEAKPDLILLAGDYLINGVRFGTWIDPESVARVLGGLQAPLGVVAVLGNHDWWNDGYRVRRALRENGITVLENQALPLERDGQRFFVVGLADALTRQVRLGAARAAVPEGAPYLVLAHEPDIFVDVPPDAALTLAGHTHGGQVSLPLLGRPVVGSQFGQRYAVGHVVEGANTDHEKHLFVTSGVGTSIFPVRFGVPPEIALLTLR